MKLDSGFRFPCVTVKKIKIEVKSTSSPDQKVKAQNSFIHAGFQNHKGSNPTSEMSKISFSCGLDKWGRHFRCLPHFCQCSCGFAGFLERKIQNDFP